MLGLCDMNIYIYILCDDRKGLSFEIMLYCLFCFVTNNSAFSVVHSTFVHMALMQAERATETTERGNSK